LILIFAIFFVNFIFAFGVDKFKIDGKIEEKVREAIDSGEEKIEVIVELKNKTVSFSEFDKPEVAQEVNAEKNNDVFSSDDFYSIELTGREIYELERMDEVEKIYYNYPVKVFLQQSVPLINADMTWDLEINGLNLTGSGQTVCIIDTGVDFTHPDLIGKNLTCNIDCYNKECVPNCSVLDDHGHGTHVAGIVGAFGGINGTGPDVKIAGVKVLNSAGGGSLDDVLDGIDWCIDNSDLYNISVISMSLGVTSSSPPYNEIPFDDYCDDYIPILTNLIDLATSQNISVIVASGNELGAGYITNPACVTNAIPVGSVRKDDAMLDFNRNWLLKLVAPGYNINSTYDGDYAFASGTSMATPHVAGAIAIMNQVLDLTGQAKIPSQIETILYDSGKKIPEGNDVYSRIDVCDAILVLDNIDPIISLEEFGDGADRSFNCNFSDWQLKNVTMKVWEGEKIYHNETWNVSGSFGSKGFDLKNLTAGNYSWNCYVYDDVGNLGSNLSNLSFIVEGVSSTLLSPINNSYTNANISNFSCSSFSDERYELENVSFYLWRGEESIINETKNLEGHSDNSYFNLSFAELNLSDGCYSWNCETSNNKSNSSFSIYNYSIVYDVTSPEISNLRVSTDLDSATVSWDTDEDSNSSTSLGGSSSDWVRNHSILISGLVLSQPYSVDVISYDRAGNFAVDSVDFITTVLATQASSPGGGDTGGSSTSSGSVLKLEEGVYINRKLAVNQTVSFYLNGENHSIKVVDIDMDKVVFLIRSDYFYFQKEISEGEEEKMNLSSNYFYDLLIKVEDVTADGKVNLTLSKINERIEVLNVDDIMFRTMDKGDKVIDSDEKFWIKIFIICLVAYIIFIIFFVCKLIKSKRSGNIHEKRKKT